MRSFATASFTLSSLLFLSVIAAVHSEELPYLAFYKEHRATIGPSGHFKEGEIEIALDEKTIEEIEKTQIERWKKKGLSDEVAKKSSKVGIFAEDAYWIWIRDPVIFPSGAKGTYNRILWKKELDDGPAGVAVLPILPGKRIALNLNFRHATRSWELELPRGGILPNETPEKAASREVAEETGLEIGSLHFLGNIAPDSGVLSSVVPVYLGLTIKKGDSNQEESEAIATILSFTKEELKEGLKKGYMEIQKGQKTLSVPLRDSFLTFALLQAELRGLL